MSGPIDLILEQYHRALDAVVTGDSAPMKELISRRDDVTLANPLGPPARGWKNVEKTMDHAISHFRDGEPTRFERISEVVGTELAYIVELERTRVKIAGSDEFVPIALRVTTIFHLEDGAWKVLHRHADPITAPRSIDSIVQ
jgi:ketosteroid isomerase-like protein